MLIRIAAILLVFLGQVSIVLADSDSRFPLRVENAKLVDADGRDYRVVGDAAWTLIVALTLDEAEDYFIARKSAGFNTVLVELIETTYRGPQNRSGVLPFPDGGDFTAPSVDYFKHAIAVMNLARKYEFLVLLNPAYLGYQCRNNWCRKMLRTPDSVLEQYGKYVGSLFADNPNIIWVHGGDVDAMSYDAIGKVEAVYRGINAAIPDQLHTAHCSRNFSAVDCYNRPWLNVNTTYSDCDQSLHRVWSDAERVASMPSIYIEGRYEEEKSTDHCIRAQLWWSQLGGSAGHIFGNKRIWLFEPDWKHALDTPGTQAMTVSSNILSRLDTLGHQVEPGRPANAHIRIHDWSTAWARLLEPSYSFNQAWGTKFKSLDEIAVASSPGLAIFYVPYLTVFSYDQSDRTLCWIDPRDGAIQPVETSRSSIRSPDARDWLFLAEEKSQICASAEDIIH